VWAAHEAVRRLGIAEVDDDGLLHGKAMVVGATGSIGSVCARLLALAADELWLVSPETAKLLARSSRTSNEKTRGPSSTSRRTRRPRSRTWT
jgi:predicted amino acid dehydrogenase